MLNILITGATGNVGIEVIKSLQRLSMPSKIVAGVRDAATDNVKLKAYNIINIKFDLTDSSTFAAAFKNIDVLFLLRPPQISAVKKYFLPLIKSAIQEKIKHIVFLSVQGVEKSRIIPHHKIEKLIVESKIAYTFLRPGYFMQNFTTTLNNDLVNKKRIYLPAGNAKFTLVDVRDIGNVAATVIANAAKHINKSYELTCNQKLNFHEMAEKLSNGLGIKIKYESPNLLNFYITKRKEKTPFLLIMILIMLHYLPRFGEEPQITNCIIEITGIEAINFETFILNNKKLLL
ncbi:MAG: NmrA family NAD(P)-binding protein [Burkholderiales bacterium]|nr:NmrA family NAD(P)-binding protein [Flavobacterium sp.]